MSKKFYTVRNIKMINQSERIVRTIKKNENASGLYRCQIMHVPRQRRSQGPARLKLEATDPPYALQKSCSRVWNRSAGPKTARLAKLGYASVLRYKTNDILGSLGQISTVDVVYCSGHQTGVREASHGGTPALHIKIRCWGLGATRKVKK